jgi:hypothetical protein
MNIGYMVGSFSLQDLRVQLADLEAATEPVPGARLGLGERTFVSNEPPVRTPEFRDGKALLVKVEYDNQDIVARVGDANGTVVTLATIKEVSFMDAEDALKFGNLFNPQEVQARRDTFRCESLIAGEFARKYVVIRAMTKDSSHIFPMDYAYLSSGSVVKTMAKKVVEAYESGDRSRLYSSTEKTLMLALDHAATMALSYSEPQHVTCAVIDNKHLYKARNPGEFFYDGEGPVKAETLIEVSSEGLPTLAATTPTKHRLPTPGY